MHYKNSSGDDIANVNFLRRYGMYVLQNTKKENLLRSVRRRRKKHRLVVEVECLASSSKKNKKVDELSTKNLAI